jgi:hypothetical protein
MSRRTACCGRTFCLRYYVCEPTRGPGAHGRAIQTLLRTSCTVLRLALTCRASTCGRSCSHRTCQNALTPPSSSDTDTAAHTDDADTLASDLASSSSWDEPKVVVLQSVRFGGRDQLPHVKDHTFALVRRGVGNLRRLFSMKMIQAIHEKTTLCHNSVLKVFSVGLEYHVYQIVKVARILLLYSYTRCIRAIYDKNRTSV